ncbi:MAG: alpha-L-arabinofuranosidase C-terminal domain-containing protein, partial [Phycisphaerales bacterium]
NPYTALAQTPYPVVGRSPWQVVGDASRVTMSTDDAFVGDHSPRLAPGAEIRQLDIALASGREYAGYLWIKAVEGAPKVTIRMDSAKGGVTVDQPGAAYARYAFACTAEASTDHASLSIVCEGGTIQVGAVSLMPADNVNGLRADTLALLKELNSPIYRWPGGNFVSGYDWRDGVGDRDRRPPRTNPAWTGIESNDFGMHEFIDLCRALRAEPLITINMGFEGAFSAEAQVEYANAHDGMWARQRAANGAPEPFGVNYWGIGNEMWGDWQLGFMSPEDYQRKHNWVVSRLRKGFPDIRTIASGNAGEWSRGLLEQCADTTDMIAEHFYVQHESDVTTHVGLVPAAIRAKAEFHRATQSQLANLGDRRIPVAMTEWNYWYGPHLYGELGTRYFLRDALGIAAGLNEYSRSTDIITAAFYAQTVNVIGAIKTTDTETFLETTALPLIMYRRHFGTIPVELDDGGSQPLGIDVAAAWTADRSALTIAVVNSGALPRTISATISGAQLSGEATLHRFAGDPEAFNLPGEPRIKLEREEHVPFAGSLGVPAHSSSIYVIPASK